MRITVLGTDARYACLREMLDGAASVGELIITPWPPPADLEKGSIVVTCGPKNGPEGAVDLLLDEDYQQELAVMTAEGAAWTAMAAARRMISGSECLVAGWGRIGRALTGILIGLGANVTVLSRRQAAFAEICAAGGKPLATDNARNAVAGKDIVFCTAPAMIFDKKALVNAKSGALIIDLASPPYGVDIQAAEKLGLKAWREPGLPGRYCPASAAAAIFRALVRKGLVKEAGNDD